MPATQRLASSHWSAGERCDAYGKHAQKHTHSRKGLPSTVENQRVATAPPISRFAPSLSCSSFGSCPSSGGMISAVAVEGEGRDATGKRHRVGYEDRARGKKRKEEAREQQLTVRAKGGGHTEGHAAGGGVDEKHQNEAWGGRRGAISRPASRAPAFPALSPCPPKHFQLKKSHFRGNTVWKGELGTRFS